MVLTFERQLLVQDPVVFVDEEVRVGRSLLDGPGVRLLLRGHRHIVVHHELVNFEFLRAYLLAEEGLLNYVI